MTSKRQIKSLSVTSDPITAGLSQEMDALLNNDRIADARTHCHVFLDCIRSRRKLVRGSGNNGQELKYGGRAGSHGHVQEVWRTGR